MREMHATSSNSNSQLLNFFQNLVDEFPNRKGAQNKKEETGKDIYKWTSSDLSIKTSAMFLSAKPFDGIFDTTSMFIKPSFLQTNSFFSTKTSCYMYSPTTLDRGNDSTSSAPLPSQYKFVRNSKIRVQMYI